MLFTVSNIPARLRFDFSLARSGISPLFLGHSRTRSVRFTVTAGEGGIGISTPIDFEVGPLPISGCDAVMGADFYDACVRLGRENIADELYGTRGTHWSAGQAIDSGCFPHF
ncbi:hypothetical protein VNI00_006168, partial [Paramarasmius palmivorus]